MSDSPPRSTSRSSGVRARRSAIDHIADHGDARELPDLFDGSSVDAASISTSTFSVIPPSLPATIDEDLFEDDDVVASEVDPDDTASAELDDVRTPVTDAPAPTPIVVATIDRADPLDRPAPANDLELVEPNEAQSDVSDTSLPSAAQASAVQPSTTEASTTSDTSPAAKTPAASHDAPKVPAAKSPAAKRPATQKPSASSAARSLPAEKPAASLAVKSPAAKSPAAKSPAAKSSAAKSSAAKSSAAKSPAAKKPVAKKPVAKKPVAKKPVAKKPVAKKPAAPALADSKGSATQPETTTATPDTTAPAVVDAPVVEELRVVASVADEPPNDTPSPETPQPDAPVADGEERTPKHVRLASTTIVIDLPPADAQEVPAEERAVAIDEEPVTTAEDLEPVTSSVPVAAEPAKPTDREDRVDEKPAAPAFAGMSVARALAGAPESSAMLTAERLLDDRRDSRRVPEGFWQKLLFDVSGRRIRLADSRAARARTALTERIARPLTGGARFVPVLTRKGGVGKTTVTTLLGMALADARDDRVIAVDANPDRGTLAERLARRSDHTVRDLVRGADAVAGYAEFSALVSRDSTRLDVLASDTDPHLSQAFDEHDYDVVARLASQYYSIVLTDCGTGIVHSVMGATLRHADTLVIVSGTSVDEARSASETLSWLEANGYPELAAEAVVVINSTTPGTPSVRLDEIEKHFESRVRNIVRVPFDAHLATGAAITFTDLGDATRLAVRELAAAVVEGLPGGRPRKASARG